jgi:hypothetical protein
VCFVEEGGDPPCDGTKEWLERYYGAYAKFMGATLAPGERIEYYFAPSEVSRRCRPNAAACTYGTTIYAGQPVLAHEIVHANASLVGRAPALFAEGFAVVLGCGVTGDAVGQLELSDPIESLVESEPFRDWCVASNYLVYNTAASFVRYLLDTFGSSRFLSFYARVPGDGQRREIEAVFQAEMGVPLDAAFSDWRTKPHPYYGDLCLRLMECDPTMPALAQAEVALGCGPTASAPIVQDAALRFEVPEERIVRLTTEPGPGEPAVSFYRCSGGDVVGTGIWRVQTFALDVPPGKYVAWFQDSGKDGAARLHVDVAEQPSPMRNTACQGAEQPLALDDEDWTLLASRWIERPCQGPWCPGQSWDVSMGATGGALEAQALSADSPLSPGELYICSEPCPEDASQCEILDLAVDPASGKIPRSKQSFAPGAVLHLGAPAASYAEHFAVRLRGAPE